MRDLIDLDRYPLDRPDSDGWAALVARCRDDLARDGMFNLHGLVRAEVAAEAAAGLAPRFEQDAFTHARGHNIYFSGPIAELPPDHPAQRRLTTENRTLCADQLPQRPLLALYEWAPLRRFIAAVMEMAELHLMDDPLARVNVMQYREGQALNWHFDRSEFTTTLLLQAPEAGGVFEYRTNLRSEDDPNHAGVGRLLSGEDPELRQLNLTPGTLNVFRGKNTAHRVTPVQGARPRIIAVFSYYQSPGVTFSPEERTGFYGRAV